MSAKKQTTFAKMQRELAVKERRARKQQRKQERKEEKLRAAEGANLPVDVDEPIAHEADAPPVT
jgi:hypothetical protein